MTFEHQFGFWERLLHRFAFRSGFSQVMLADLEDRTFPDDVADATLDRPVFISGLPRSGTTILLQLLYDTGHFAAHTYQDMPFLLCPILWNRFARRFMVERVPRERAHGDGLEISSRSPEAFEEVIWKQFWPGHYSDDRIDPWIPTDRNAEFDAFFKRHIAKIIAVRSRDRQHTGRLRYLSKNNVNISRLDGLQGPLRKGTLLIPFREPLQHAASMLAQHRRFSELHGQDRFALRYMEGIGHHDFGLTLRPINFGGWLEEAGDPNALEFWLRYWNAAYQYVLDHIKPSIHLISFAQLTSESETLLLNVADLVQIPVDALRAFADRLEPPKRHDIGWGQVTPSVRKRASEIHKHLKAV